MVVYFKKIEIIKEFNKKILMSLGYLSKNLDVEEKKRTISEFYSNHMNFNFMVRSDDESKPYYFYYSNVIFEVEIINNKIKFSTRIAFPSMIINGLDKYKIVKGYKFKTLTNNLYNATKDCTPCLTIEVSKFNNTYKCVGNIPCEVILICKMAVEYNFSNCKYDNMSDILIKKYGYECFRCENMLNTINSLEQNNLFYGSLEINNDNWRNYDRGKYKNLNKCLTEFFHVQIHEINRKIEKHVNTNGYILRPSSVSEGGLGIEQFNYLFGYHYISSRLYHESLRCFYNKLNIYDTKKSPILSIVMLNEFINCENIETTLTFENITTYKSVHRHSMFTWIKNYLF